MNPLPDLEARLRAAADAMRGADALLIGAGAGMGVDSGLPDFRGPEGFWKAYPPFRGRQFSELSTPHWFRTDPGLAWGFFGHRLNRYRAAGNWSYPEDNSAAKKRSILAQASAAARAEAAPEAPGSDGSMKPWPQFG
jgi:hypothetical protein